MRIYDGYHPWSQFWDDLMHKRDRVLENGEFLESVNINNAIVEL